MRKGFTLIEIIVSIVVLSILSAFTFSVVWQYSKIYADTKGGFVYGEGAAVLERITRELRDAQNVDNPGVYGLGNPNKYLTFQLTHGTPTNWTGSPAVPPNPPYWVQYCIAQTATPGIGTGITRALLYRVELVTGTPPFADQCVSGVPVVSPGQNPIYSVALMSRHIMSTHTAVDTVTASGFQVYGYLGNPGTDFSYQITLSLTADPTQMNRMDGAQYANNVSVTLVSGVSPRNYCPENGTCQAGTGVPASKGSDRAFNADYYDQIK